MEIYQRNNNKWHSIYFSVCRSSEKQFASDGPSPAKENTVSDVMYGVLDQLSRFKFVMCKINFLLGKRENVPEIYYPGYKFRLDFCSIV